MGALKSLGTTGPSPLFRLQELPLSIMIKKRLICNVIICLVLIRIGWEGLFGHQRD